MVETLQSVEKFGDSFDKDLDEESNLLDTFRGRCIIYDSFSTFLFNSTIVYQRCLIPYRWENYGDLLFLFVSLLYYKKSKDWDGDIVF